MNNRGFRSNLYRNAVNRPEIGILSLYSSYNGIPKNIRRTTLNGLAVYAIYQTLLTALRTEALFKEGVISRNEQYELIYTNLIKSFQKGTILNLTIGIVVLLLPLPSLPFKIFGLIGVGKASQELLDAFWNCLNQTQKNQLLNYSFKAGINLSKIINTDVYQPI